MAAKTALPEPSKRPLLLVAATGLVAAAGIFAFLKRTVPTSPDPRLRSAQALGAGAAILCVSVALDSGIEHYRGRFKDPAMFLGPALAVTGLIASSFVVMRPGRSHSGALKAAFGATAVTGAIGLGFHAYNILKRPGELGELNLFYAAPPGAPAALTLAGGLGLIAGRVVAGRSSPLPSRLLAQSAAAIVAVGLFGTVAEAGLLHFRGAFQNPAMYAPVTIPPLAAIAIGAAALSPSAARIARPLLNSTAVLGIAGPMFHAYGIHRNMGGWRNWSQMILQGPPLPAPPAFLGLAIAGLGVVPLLERQRH